ncbi:MAG TPA: AMP-binding protein [Chromatiaceae bacterium]|nr:AMP-binding protein [Chromatiaceae bacterium]
MANPPSCWTQDALRRLLADLIAAEWSRLRPGLPCPRLVVDPGVEDSENSGVPSDCRRIDAGPHLPGPGSRLPEPSATGTSASAAAPPAGGAGQDTDLDLDNLGLDSLEFLDLATTVAVQFHLFETGLDRALLAQRRLTDWIGIIQASRARWDQAVSFQTSGTQGRPQLHAHRMNLLAEEIDYFAARLGDRRRVLVAVPSHHIYGFLFGIMLPARLGLPVVEARDALPGGVLARARTGDLLIAHPTFLELATRGPVRVAPGVTLVTSTAPCPEAVWRRLEAGGVNQILEIYGASETAGIGVRAASDAPFELLPCWSRPAGAQGRILRTGADGLPLEQALPDQVQWLATRRFRVRGRRDGAVQVGGINVFPERVRACLLEHPEVREASVRLASPAQGGRLKAFVVPVAASPDPAGLPGRLQVWLEARLSTAERPRAIAVGPHLPRSPLGKLRDW